MSKLVDISTVIAATAGLWALAIAWVTYVASIWHQNQDEYNALKSIVEGLRVELDGMKPWTEGPGGQGYLRNTTPPPDWSNPRRFIWKFDIGAILNLTRSSYLYRLKNIIGPFALLNFSVSRLFQLYDEYRSFANSNPGVLAAPPPWYTDVIQDFNTEMHVKLIGGEDSDDPNCLYKTYKEANSALLDFDTGLKKETILEWYLCGHLFSAACFVSGIFLLFRLLWC